MLAKIQDPAHSCSYSVSFDTYRCSSHCSYSMILHSNIIIFFHIRTSEIHSAKDVNYRSCRHSWIQWPTAVAFVRLQYYIVYWVYFKEPGNLFRVEVQIGWNEHCLQGAQGWHMHICIGHKCANGAANNRRFYLVCRELFCGNRSVGCAARVRT